MSPERKIPAGTDTRAFLKVVDLFSFYKQEAAGTPLLTQKEEVELAKRIKAGARAYDELASIGGNPEKRRKLENDVEDGKAAEKHFVHANMRLVINVAKKYIGHEVPFLDLIQEGNIGLIRAVRKFEGDRGCKFSTYGTWWIKREIIKALADQGKTIRVPVRMGERIKKLRRIRIELFEETGKEPSIEEIAKKMEKNVRSIQKMMATIKQAVISLDDPAHEQDDGSESVIGDFIEDEDSPNPDEIAEQNERKKRIEKFLSRLPAREERVLRLRYGLSDGESRTLEEVGKILDITGERVRQIKEKAFQNIRRLINEEVKREWLEGL